MPDWLIQALGDPIWLNLQDAVRITAAVILGGLIGMEREVRDKPAGLRTIILICIGACVFTMISERIGGPDWNKTRIAAQVVTGIGFLGAGAIMRDRRNVFGLTTAATIWAVAAIGMAVGFGQIPLAALGTAAILIALLVLDFIEKWISALWDIQEYYVAMANEDGATERITTIFAAAKLRTKHRACYEDGTSLVFHISATGAKSQHERLRIKLARSSECTLRKA